MVGQVAKYPKRTKMARTREAEAAPRRSFDGCMVHMYGLTVAKDKNRHVIEPIRYLLKEKYVITDVI